MKGTKKWFNRFDLYDKYRLAAFFEEQASAGWILEDYEGTAFLFRRGEPQKLHYCVIYRSEGTIFDTELTEAQETFCDFCAVSGWRLVTTKGYAQVFCNEREDPVPIQTEPELELNNIHAFYKSTQKNYLLICAVALSQLVTKGFSLIIGNQNVEDQIFNITLFLFWGIMLLIYMIEILSYCSWYRKAKCAIELGLGIPETKGNRARQIIQYGLLAFSLLIVQINMCKIESIEFAVVTFLISALLIVSVFFLVRLLRSKLFVHNGSGFKKGFYVLMISVFCVLTIGIFFICALYL